MLGRLVSMLNSLALRLSNAPLPQAVEDTPCIDYVDASTATDGIPDTVSGTELTCPECGEEFILMLGEDPSAPREGN